MKNIAVSFNDMLERLESAFETEKRLVADASHELRTPLSIIKAQCDVLLQDDIILPLTHNVQIIQMMRRAR